MYKALCLSNDFRPAFESLESRLLLSGYDYFTALHTFSSLGYDPDGASPDASVVFDSQGNMYGTAASGGPVGDGTIFEISSTGAFSTLYSFSGADGSLPVGALAIDAQGNLYGASEHGGTGDHGTVFKLSSSGTLTTLHFFTGTDGDAPGGIARDSQGDLFGVTYDGGTYGTGTVFEIAAGGSFSTLYTFAAVDGGQVNADGATPVGGIAVNSQGDIFGSTMYGGSDAKGVLYEIPHSGSYTVLHVFNGGNDGNGVQGRLTLDSQGDLFGTDCNAGSGGYGVLFEIPNGGSFTELYSFTNSTTDGGEPRAGVVLDSQGDMFGTTTEGGANGNGTIFEIPAGSSLATLYSFDVNLSPQTNVGGFYANSGVMLDAQGNLIGAANEGGFPGGGTIFELSTEPLGPYNPVNLTPYVNDTLISLTPTLTASTFTDSSQTQAASEWVVTQVSNSTVAWDSGRDTNSSDFTSVTVPGGDLLFGTQYSWKVRYQDGNGAWSDYSTPTRFTTLDDTTPPTPNPETWATAPYATGDDSISMTATTATDPSGVEYDFYCGTNGHDSGWQTSATWTDTGLSPNTQYTYQVCTRDQSANHNTGSLSTGASATTNGPDTTPPTPDPETWAVAPYAASDSAITMTASTATDPSGVEYDFINQTNAHESGWQASATWTDMGLDPDTQYTYVHKLTEFFRPRAAVSVL